MFVFSVSNLGVFPKRVANEIHSSSTKQNKEWQEKLPIVVLKAEEIMYSKANSEVLFSSQSKPLFQGTRFIFLGFHCLFAKKVHVSHFAPCLGRLHGPQNSLGSNK